MTDTRSPRPFLPDSSDPSGSACAPELFNPADKPVPLLSVAQLRACEARAQAALAPHTLMARAGAAAARLLLDELLALSCGAPSPTDAQRSPASPPLPVWIAAGPGNNGGDALVLATHLHRAGVAVQVCMPVEVKPDDARHALADARAAGVPVSSNVPADVDALAAYGWVVDGLFGIGLTRALEGAFATLARLMSARARRRGGVLALDVPSGLDSDTGNVVGDGAGGTGRANGSKADETDNTDNTDNTDSTGDRGANETSGATNGGKTSASPAHGLAVRATHTITFIAAKPGLFTAHGRDHAGRVRVAPIGIDARADAPGAARLNAPALFAHVLPARAFATHKGTFGTLAVIGGDTGMCGAPILAARAALYAGAGKVHAGFVGRDAPPYDAPHPELMLRAASELPFASIDAFAIGCGMGTGENARRLLERVLQLDAPTLLDADALNLIARDPALAGRVIATANAGGAQRANDAATTNANDLHHADDVTTANTGNAHRADDAATTNASAIHRANNAVMANADRAQRATGSAAATTNMSTMHHATEVVAADAGIAHHADGVTTATANTAHHANATAPASDIHHAHPANDANDTNDTHDGNGATTATPTNSTPRYVLTPHPLEAARLLGVDAPTIQRDRLAAARALAARFAAVVVLKGSGTVVASPDGRLALNPTGNAGLASGGTGDVLGGLIGALLAQRVPPFEAALAGVYLHGLAADTLSADGDGPAGLAASELAPRVRRLLNQRFYR